AERALPRTLGRQTRGNPADRRRIKREKGAKPRGPDRRERPRHAAERVERDEDPRGTDAEKTGTEPKPDPCRCACRRRGLPEKQERSQRDDRQRRKRKRREAEHGCRAGNERQRERQRARRLHACAWPSRAFLPRTLNALRAATLRRAR